MLRQQHAQTSMSGKSAVLISVDRAAKVWKEPILLKKSKILCVDFRGGNGLLAKPALGCP